MKKLTAALLMMSATVAVAAPFDNSLTEEAIKKRIAPVGTVYLAGADQLLLNQPALAQDNKCIKQVVSVVTVPAL